MLDATIGAVNKAWKCVLSVRNSGMYPKIIEMRLKTEVLVRNQKCASSSATLTTGSQTGNGL